VVLGATSPFAAAIGVFGTIYGAGASAVADPATIVLSSLVVFSGAVQFAAVGLLLTGAGPLAVLLTAAMLNSRNLLLGAALRSSLEEPRRKRAFLAWWLVDETAGLTLASPAPPGRTLLISGAFCYAAWVIGTAFGVLGASLASLEELVAAVFPVLFVGLAAQSTRTRDAVHRVAAAAVVSLLLAFAVPEIRSVIPAIAAVAVAMPGEKG